jgi:hypothetical protein
VAVDEWQWLGGSGNCGCIGTRMSVIGAVLSKIESGTSGSGRVAVARFYILKKIQILNKKKKKKKK